jgi:hypothetical protein
MIQKHRISTNIGKDQVVNVEINQDYDLLEILSLKFSQRDIYTSLCSDYGVVCGRITANNGLGVPNARVSIFVPQNTIDSDDPVISALYPYTDLSVKDGNNKRYNLLPARQQHGGHTPTGTFFDQTDILSREEVLEVFENYYSFTVKTNDAGDFMIWGVPLGQQTIHVDLDLSDIGCFSLRPYDFIKQGVGENKFERFYKFKSSDDLGGLPQIVTFDKTINVFPFWGNEDLCQIGITRTDFDLSEKGIKIEPISLILLSSVTDDDGHAVKRSGVIRPKSGYKCNLQTSEGKIECIRETGNRVYGSDGVTLYPELETYNITETINQDGVAMVVLPMNLEYVYTNEFGEQEITNDKNKGIPTTAIARFRVSLDILGDNTGAAKYLIPNIREFNPNSTGVHNQNEYSEAMLSTYTFSDVFEDYLKVPKPFSGLTYDTTNFLTADKNHKKDLILGTNNSGIPEDYFYKFIFGKVYSPTSFQGSHYEVSSLESFFGLSRKDAFLGIKEIRPNVEDDCTSKTNYIPTNFAYRNRIKLALLISEILLFIQYIFTIIQVFLAETLASALMSVGRAFYSLSIVDAHRTTGVGASLEKFALKVVEANQLTLPLTVYPDCEVCSLDADGVVNTSNLSYEGYCRSGEIKTLVYPLAGNVYLVYYTGQTNVSTTSGTTFLPNYFSGESAKETCATGFTENNLADLDNYTIAGQPSGYNSRFAAMVYPIQDVTSGDTFNFFSTTFNSSNFYFDTGTLIINGTVYQNILCIGIPFADWTYYGGRDYSAGIDYTSLNDLHAVIRVYDLANPKNTINTTSDLVIETGCQKYDKFYNETNALSYIWASGSTMYSQYGVDFPSNFGRTPTTGEVQAINMFNCWADCENPTFQKGKPYYEGTSYFTESLTQPAGNWTLVATVAGDATTYRLPNVVNLNANNSFSQKNVKFNKKTKSGLTEMRDGVFTIVPVYIGNSKNMSILKEWYKRKRVGLFFCGGVVNFSFIDNWLNGLLYFFKFDYRIRWDNENEFDLGQRASKFPRELVFFNVLDKNFYYRSTPYNRTSGFVGQKYSSYKELLHPTTFYDVGVRDEFLYEICTDPRIDPTCSVVRDISATSYQDPGYVIEHAINYRMDISNAKFDVGDFFSGSDYGSNISTFDGDITQLMSINCEAGIEAFDLDSPHYFMFNGELLDPEAPATISYFKAGNTSYGPVPIDFKLDNNGAFIRLCLNYRLGDYSQKVPFFLWNKGGTGFGPYNDATSDQQKWDRNPSKIATEKLQRIFSIGVESGTTTNYLMADGEEEYLLKPMTITHAGFSVTGNTEDMLERFENISCNTGMTGCTLVSLPNTTAGAAVNNVEGDLWLVVTSGTTTAPEAGDMYVVVNKTWVKHPEQYVHNYRETFITQTQLNYSGNKQVLSTPFLFYFGLRPEKTALDLLIKYYGPKGAFPAAE